MWFLLFLGLLIVLFIKVIGYQFVIVEQLDVVVADVYSIRVRLSSLTAARAYWLRVHLFLDLKHVLLSQPFVVESVFGG
jgi:hypothetical protein